MSHTVDDRNPAGLYICIYTYIYICTILADFSWFWHMVRESKQMRKGSDGLKHACSNSRPPAQQEPFKPLLQSSLCQRKS